MLTKICASIFERSGELSACAATVAPASITTGAHDTYDIHVVQKKNFRGTDVQGISRSAGEYHFDTTKLKTVIAGLRANNDRKDPRGPKGLRANILARLDDTRCQTRLWRRPNLVPQLVTPHGYVLRRRRTRCAAKACTESMMCAAS